MWKKSALFPLAATVVTLLSCATTGTPTTLTVELFDSTPWKGNAEEAANAAFLVAMPEVADLAMALPGSRLRYDASIPAASPPMSSASAQQGRFLNLPAPPAAVDSAPVDAGLSLGSIPRSTGAFVLRAPEPPSVPTAVRTTAAPVPASRQGSPRSSADLAPQPAKTAPAETASASGAAASGAAGSPSVTPAVPAVAGQAPNAAGSADSYGRLREIYARQGDELQIGLEGTGFLFLGFPDKSSEADGMSFKSKETRNSQTWFTFEALKLGTYDLDFLLQENTTGKSTKETVRVHVVTDQEFNSAVSQQSGQGVADSATSETGDPVFAQRLSASGAYEAAITELQKGYQEGNPGLNDQIASLYVRIGSYDAASKYYAKNLSPQNPYTERAVIGMVRIAIAQKDQQEFLSLLNRFLAARDPAAEETLIQAARMEQDLSQIGVGLDLAAEYAARYPDGQWRDEADFIQAQLLEADSQFRDIARARSLYQEIVSVHPEGPFAGPARERLLYIERHFYQVR